MLPAEEIEHLERLGLEYQVQAEAGVICVVIQGYELPPGYTPDVVDLLLRLPQGFPDVAPDMWWTDPVVEYASGGTPPQTELRENHLGRSWQRWSRHLSAGQWRPGRDSVQTFMRIIRSDLESGVMPAAA